MSAFINVNKYFQSLQTEFVRKHPNIFRKLQAFLKFKILILQN